MEHDFVRKLDPAKIGQEAIGHPTKIGHITNLGHLTKLGQPPKLGLRAIGDLVKLGQEAHSNPSPRLQSGQRRTSPSVVTGPPGQRQLLANLFKTLPIFRNPDLLEHMLCVMQKNSDFHCHRPLLKLVFVQCREFPG